MNIGNRIKEKRLSKNWTQEQLAQKLHVSRAAISSWEVGRNFPDLETILLISDLFDISLDKLLREDSDMVKSTTRKTKRFLVYKLAAIFLGIFLVCYIGYNQKLHYSERMYRSNLQSHGWKNDNQSIGGKDAYTKTEGGISYYTYILQTGITGLPLSEQNVNVITTTDKLVVDIIDKNKFVATLTNARDKDIDFTAKVDLDKNASLVRFNGKYSETKKNKIRKYLIAEKNNYKKLIQKGTVQRNQIIK